MAIFIPRHGILPAFNLQFVFLQYAVNASMDSGAAHILTVVCSEFIAVTTHSELIIISFPYVLHLLHTGCLFTFFPEMKAAPSAPSIHAVIPIIWSGVEENLLWTLRSSFILASPFLVMVESIISQHQGSSPSPFTLNS